MVIRLFRPFYFFLFTFVCFGGERVRVASYNVRNYLVMDRLVAGRWVEDSPKPDANSAQTAAGEKETKLLAEKEKGDEKDKKEKREGGNESEEHKLRNQSKRSRQKRDSLN